MKRRPSIQDAIDMHDNALLRGLCPQGAREVALTAFPQLDPSTFLHALQTRDDHALINRSPTAPVFHLKRVYEPAAPADGHRVLVDRLWPRGLSKADAAIDVWMKELAPSTPLRKWFNHDAHRWEEFLRRYHQELNDQPTAIATLLALAREKPITLLYAARDDRHNNAIALQAYLLQQAPEPR